MNARACVRTLVVDDAPRRRTVFATTTGRASSRNTCARPRRRRWSPRLVDVDADARSRRCLFRDVLRERQRTLVATRCANLRRHVRTLCASYPSSFRA